MKAITCEMCSSTDVVKIDGMYVCQSCGTKYSVEEARKLMIEGTVDVSGSTVKVDKTDDLKNLYAIARRAKNNNDNQQAAQYYDMIQQKDPNSWEAAFYSVLFSAYQTNIAGISNAAIRVSNCLSAVVKLVHDHVEESKQKSVLEEIYSQLFIFATTLKNAAISTNNEIEYTVRCNNPQYDNEMNRRIRNSNEIFESYGNAIDQVFGNSKNITPIVVKCWKYCLDESGVNDKYLKMLEKYDSQLANQYREQRKKQIEASAERDAHIGNIVKRVLGFVFSGLALFCFFCAMGIGSDGGPEELVSGFTIGGIIEAIIGIPLLILGFKK